MSIAILILLFVIVAFVAIDTLARREPVSHGRRDQTLVTTEKIIVDLSKRR